MDEFVGWARACVEATAARVHAGLPAAVTPRLEGAGQAITTASGYESRYVGFDLPHGGSLSLWLYVSPLDHEYGTNPHSPQHGAGIMRNSQDVVSEAAGAHWFKSGSPFRWQKLRGGWELYVLLETLPVGDDPDQISARFAPRVLYGLRRAALIPA